MKIFNTEIEGRKETSSFPFRYAGPDPTKIEGMVHGVLSSAVLWVPPEVQPDLALTTVKKIGDTLLLYVVDQKSSEVGVVSLSRGETLTSYPIWSASGCLRGFVGCSGRDVALEQLLDTMADSEVVSLRSSYMTFSRSVVNTVGRVSNRAVMVSGEPVRTVQLSRGLVLSGGSLHLFAETPVPDGVQPIVKIDGVSVGSGDIFLTESSEVADLHVTVGAAIKISAITE